MFSPQLNPTVPSSRSSRPRSTTPSMSQNIESARRTIGRTENMRISSKPPTREGSVSGKKETAGSSATTAASQQQDGTSFLTQNDKYGVVKLPGVPNALRTAGPSTTGAIDSTQRNHALLLSHGTAYIWKYTDLHALPHTFSFRLPLDESLSNPEAPLPVGSLVTPTANSDEPGLVVVLPVSGHISYWDSVGAAVAEGLLGKRRGYEGRVGLMAGEHVLSITSVEPAGFILALTSGRVARLSLTTSSGAPEVSVVFMKGATGMLGSFINTFKPSSFRRDIVAIRAGAQLGGSEREAIVATARGTFFRWKVYRNGGEKCLAEVDLRDQIIYSMRQADSRATNRNFDTLAVLDVAVGKYADSESGSADDSTLDCLVFVALLPTPGSEEDTLYALIEISFVAGGRSVINRALPITCYSTAPEITRTSRPRVFLPKPRNTAFLVLPRAVVIASLLKTPGKGLDAQGDRMMDDDDDEESETPSLIFEDVVDFKGDLNVEIIGCGAEDALHEEAKQKMNMSWNGSMTQLTYAGKRQPGVVLIAKGAAAVIRIEAYEAISEPKVVKRIPISEQVKNKLEQAVFYGDNDQNPLSFRGRKEINFPLEEIERAALSISSEIVATEGRVLKELPSLENHLAYRSKRLKMLAEHLKNNYRPLSAAARWRLCADAERLEAARRVWKDYEQRKKETRSNFMLEVFVRLSSRSSGQRDHLRNFFYKEVVNIGTFLIVWKEAVKKIKSDDQHAAVEEALQIILGILQKAYEFRISSAALYGFRDEIDAHGLLRDWKDLGEPWTSRKEALESLSTLYETVINLGKMRVQQGDSVDAMTSRLTAAMPELAELLCKIYVERYRWAADQALDPNSKTDKFAVESAAVRERYEASRSEWIKPLVYFTMAENAYEIGEKFHDYSTLVEICCEELMRLNDTMDENLDADDRDSIQQAVVGEEKRLERYFEDFGEPFAQKFYEFQVQVGSLKELLNKFQNYKHFLDKFLHSDPKFARISWIHDVGQQDYAQAGNTLLNLATKAETTNTNKRIELSIAKLALLASLGDGDNELPESQAQYIDGELDVSIMQEDIKALLVRPVANAVDHTASLDILLTSNSVPQRANPSRKPNTTAYLRFCLSKLIKNQVLSTREFLEILTIALPSTSSGFFTSIKLISMQSTKVPYRKALEALVWRRCFLADDWVQISKQIKELDDHHREDVMGKTALYRTLELCTKEGFFAEESPFRPLDPKASFAKPDDESWKEVNAEGVDTKGYAAEEISDNRILEKYISVGLDRWWEGGKEWAKNRVAEAEADREMGEDSMEDIEMND